MRLNRHDLITRVEAEIAARKAAALNQHAQDTAKYERDLAAHLAATCPAWAAFATTIRRRGRAGQPVTSTDIPEDLNEGRYSNGYVKIWTQTPPKQPDLTFPALDMVLGLLRAVTDDEISTAELARLGIRTADLFRHTS